MVRTNMAAPARVHFLYTNIGRGHPFYLDGILEALIRQGSIGLVRKETDVFELSRGGAKLAWHAVRLLYRHGSSPGVISSLYRKVRSGVDYNRPGMMLRLMGRDIRRYFLESPHPLVVAHPTLAAILRGKPHLLYQHGEVVTPSEAVVNGATTVFVPASDAAQPFLNAGYEPSQVVVTGLCIEPSLVKQAADAFSQRLERMSGRAPLVGAFFSSGAEPKPHGEKILRAIASLAEGEGKGILFARRNGWLARTAEKYFRRSAVPYTVIDATTGFPTELPSVVLVFFRNRREENSFTARLFPWFDYLVAPAHERTNWGLGLGLPMFILTPTIGPFAPLNREKLLREGVAGEITTENEAENFAERIARLRADGELSRMAKAGWGKYPLDGFERIAKFLVTTYSE